MNFIDTIQQLSTIQIVDHVESWEQAISLCLAPLLKKQYITEKYISQVIRKGQELNFYFLIAPGLGMPHASSEDGVIKTGVSLLIINSGIVFEKHQYNPIYCLIGLATVDNNEHIDILMEISDLFGDNDIIIDQLKKSTTINEVIRVLK